MIDAAIKLIADQLNQSLKNSFDLDEEIVFASNLVELNGKLAQHINDKVVVCLVGVEQETTQQNLPARESRPVRPPLLLNINVVIAANFSANRYAQGLDYLSAAIAFLYEQPIFNRASIPHLDNRIEKLTIEMVNLDLQALSNIWSVIGGKYLPSAVYRIRIMPNASN